MSARGLAMALILALMTLVYCFTIWASDNLDGWLLFAWAGSLGVAIVLGSLAGDES